MLNVLINAYAVSPNWGSEPGMGWNWIINIAKHCNVFVITEGEWKNEILHAIGKLSQKDNIHFYFNPLPDKVRKMCWNQGDWRFYWYYAKWQKKTLEIARQIIAENQIDVMHQLNMIGFREPGYLWKIKDIPLVWGPVGGIANIPTAYLKGAGWKMNLFCRLKNFISDMQFRFHPRVRAAVKRSTMIAAMKEVQSAAKRVYGKDIPIINETGTYPSTEDGNPCVRFDNNTLNVLWVGKFDFRKRLDLALKAVAATNNRNIILYICGTGTDEQIEEYRDLSDALNINLQVNWLGKVEHDQIPSLMKSADLLLFTSLSEATSTVVLEAVSAGLPIISFNLCGFGPLVENFAGKTIDVSDPHQSVMDLALQLNFFYKNRESLDKISHAEQANVYTLSWEYKGFQISKIYTAAQRGGVIVWIPNDYKDEFNILWVGKFDFRKQFSLALQSAAKMHEKGNVMFHVVAPMTEKQGTEIKSQIKQLGLQDNVILYGRVPNEKVHSLMKASDVFLFTSLSEGTPHVILEAVKNCLPIVCFDICGHGEVVDNSIGIKLPLTSSEQSSSDFAKILDDLMFNKEKLNALSANCIPKQIELSWDSKIAAMLTIYNNSISKQ
ncbi:MAG: glycosyltransferase [Muribaculum sp.]|nr:glycosyltransferase [Muribaculum sp.]